ncbi:hypothetical protein BJ322DRAFT_1093077, partial [Thelephora terrestris]
MFVPVIHRRSFANTSNADAVESHFKPFIIRPSNILYTILHPPHHLTLCRRLPQRLRLSHRRRLSHCRRLSHRRPILGVLCSSRSSSTPPRWMPRFTYAQPTADKPLPSTTRGFMCAAWHHSLSSRPLAGRGRRRSSYGLRARRLPSEGPFSH